MLSLDFPEHGYSTDPQNIPKRLRTPKQQEEVESRKDQKDRWNKALHLRSKWTDQQFEEEDERLRREAIKMAAARGLSIKGILESRTAQKPIDPSDSRYLEYKELF